MNGSQQKSPGKGGGSVAIRGLLVQTLVALLDVATADPPFTEITLEPSIGNEQFDFIWKNSNGTNAIQVKSTINTFTKAKIEKWAKRLEAVHSGENCRLILVGLFPASMDQIAHVGAVAIEKKNLNIDDLLEQAAHRLSKFLEAEGINPASAVEREMIVRALITHLELYSAKSAPITRADFIKLLRQWIACAPKQVKRIDISRIDKYVPTELIGREDEEMLLANAWDSAVREEAGRPRVVTLFALGGEGKTSLVAKFAVEVAIQNRPSCDSAFAWSFYSQEQQLSASSDLFFNEALTFFGDPRTACSELSGYEKARRLAQLISERRSLLILDGVDPLQYAPSLPTAGEFKDPGLSILVKKLATNNPGLCVITTRYPIEDLRAYRDNTAPQVELKRLSSEAGVALLRSLDVKGQQREFETLVEAASGHALTLNLIGTYLRDAWAGDIRKRDLVKLEDADNEERGGHAFRVIEAYVKWFESDGKNGKRSLAILRLMGLFDGPVPAICLTEVIRPPAIPGLTEGLAASSEANRNIAFRRLQNAKLISVQRGAGDEIASVDAHALTREYFARQISTESPDSWRIANRRLCELLRATPDKPKPTLEDLQPLYQAVVYGCRANIHQEVCNDIYKRRITRGDEKYAIRKLGAFGSDLGAVSSFFEKPWEIVSSSLTDYDKAWLLSQAA